MRYGVVFIAYQVKDELLNKQIRKLRELILNVMLDDWYQKNISTCSNLVKTDGF